MTVRGVALVILTMISGLLVCITPPGTMWRASGQGTVGASANLLATASLHAPRLVAGAAVEVRASARSQNRAGGDKRVEKPGRMYVGGDALPQYHFDVWTTDNGLPQNSVSSILQTRDGFLWLTTNDGLVRYDGVRFTIFNASNRPDLKSSRFSQLFEDGDGALWITTEDNRLIRYQDGRFTTVTTEDGLPDNRVLRIRGDEDDALLLQTTQGFVWSKAGQFVLDDPIPNRLYADFGFPARPGVVWHIDAKGLHRVENRRVTADAPISGLTQNDIKSLYEDRQGELWLGITGGILLRFKDGKFTRYEKRDGLTGGRINQIREDRRGNLWLGLSDGLMRFTNGRFTRYTTADGLAGDAITMIYEDREGILWIGTSSGLSRLRDNIITSYDTDDGLAANNTYPIFEDHDGAIWIGSWHGLTKYKDGVFTNCTEQYDTTKELVTALMRDADGALWIGSLGGGAKRCKDGKITIYQSKYGFPSNIVRAICQDRQGTMWFGTSDGLVSYKNDAFSLYTIKDGLPDNAINLVVEDREGGLWIGTQAGLCRYKDGQFTSYSQEKSLAGHTVRAVYEDGDGAVWIGTYSGGLTRLKDGKFTSYTVKEGLFNNGVFAILEDSRDNFWISCNLGIYRVSKRELTDYAEGRIKTITSIPYGKRDGMVNSECNGGVQPAGIRARDGRLWFPTQGGVAVVNPEAVPVSAKLPPVMIEEVLLNNQPVAFGETVDITPRVANFEIHYTALSFIMSERIKFKYKLEGLDADWIDAGTRRVAYYSHVPPGRYTFRVIAANRDGAWNTEGATVALRIVPPFWKTGWFLSLMLVAVAASVLLGYRLCVAHLEKARRAQEAFSQQLIRSQEGERQRIAAELHDGLGQDLLVIKNTALLGINTLKQQNRDTEMLSDISETASRAIEEVREISYNLRPYQLDDLGLSKAIDFIVAKVAASSGIRIVSEIDAIDDLFSAEAEINIYRVVQESLNNIVKHSGASRARVCIERQGQKVDITVQDNGRGFNPDRSSGNGRGGFGLKGIAERARILDARCAIHSATGQGTTISLNLEAPSAKASGDLKTRRENGWRKNGRRDDGPPDNEQR